MKKLAAFSLLSILMMACNSGPSLTYELYRSSAAGDKLSLIEQAHSDSAAYLEWEIFPDSSYQMIEGFGGAFTESSAHLWTKLNPDLQEELIAAYFSPQGAAYRMGRTHINSCDFSLNSYHYLAEGDTSLGSFSLAQDQADIIPMIKAALEYQPQLKLIASPWTAPPFMKDNKAWFGGKLLPEYYAKWARYFTLYDSAMAAEGIDLWAYTVENEPLGNDANWESMHYSPAEMGQFVKDHLGPQFAAANIDSRILIYDQNRGEELEEWADELLQDPDLLPYIHGTAVHWYTSTFDWFPESLEYTHKLAPNKAIIHTEACVDAEVPHWQDDAWYWKKEATDWGYDWAPEEDKYLHPKYVPVYRYARDIIGCLNSWVEGWVDWNMLLDPQGGPNHAKNWCVAPVLADTTKQALYYTPLYDVMRHFSKFIYPGSRRVAHSELGESLHATALKRPDGRIVTVLLNESEEAQVLAIQMEEAQVKLELAPRSIQTLILNLKD